MDKFNVAQPLVDPIDDPADIMDKVAAVSAFLCTMVDGEHVKPEGVMTLHPDAVSGLAHILGFIQSAAAQASATCK
jgi:hypothetical protein